jgi:hypothetical protein
LPGFICEFCARYVVERQYLLPVYQRLLIEADTVEEACEEAVDHDDWQSAQEDGDGSRGATISAIKLVPDDCDLDQFSLGEFLYEGDASTIEKDVPEAFREDGA